MKEAIIKARNAFLATGYKLAAKPLFFLFSPEFTHSQALFWGSLLGSNWFTRTKTALTFNYQHDMLKQEVAGITFPNPVGLAAGFDKDAQLTKILPSVGFGHMEIGSVTAQPYRGNPGKWMWRAPKHKSLLINYGLKNIGAEKIAKRILKRGCTIPLGISIAKTNSPNTVETGAGIQDYVESYKIFADTGAYTTINISCPNAFGGEPFTDHKKLNKLMTAIDKIPSKKPVFIKTSPDLTEKELDNIIAVAKKHNVTGFVCSNLTKNKRLKDFPLKGGFSGKLQEDLSTKQIAYLYKKTKGKYIIIGCGGIFTAEDAYKKIKAGATLLQLITGMIFEGPQAISQINQGLVKLLKKDGYTNISQAIGTTSNQTRAQ